ncbi:hypothetical protein PORY_000074 [Pneumocystis oryctolagi]|uniref:Uncharacterized protein n=1 Tax=Pneumocystis oryctolagi TaxID=42067 RepID=A0ACB7CES7_9ASCO|nr:hypothetical protein PORY_000074 [Pneumocystis oryctolagi]
MRRVGYAYSESYEQLKCNKLPSNLDRSSFIHSLVKAYGLFDKLTIIPPEKASFSSLCKIHDSEYMFYLLNNSKDKDSLFEEQYDNSGYESEEMNSVFGLDYDCPIFPELSEYIQFLAGTSKASARLLASGNLDVSIHWDGGRHHAKKSKAAGFCYVNDIVFAIMELRKYYQRVMYLDFDLHAGDGVESAFLHSENVLTLSFHRHDPGFFPGTGSFDLVGKGKGKYHALNVPLKKGLSGDNLILLFENIVQPAFMKFKPDVIVVQCGCDGNFKVQTILLTQLGLFKDVYKEWNLTSQSYAFCLKKILEWEKKLLIFGGGGYENTVVSRCYAFLTSVILDIEIPNDIPEHDFFEFYGPDFELLLDQGNMKDENTEEYIQNAIKILQPSCFLIFMVSIKDTFSKVSTRSTLVDYHVIASSILQRRFVQAVFITYIISYIISAIIDDTFKVFRPFSWIYVGIRALMILFSVFPLFILKKANLHVDYHTRSSLISEFCLRLFSLKTLKLTLIYLISSLFIIMININTKNAETFNSFIVYNGPYSHAQLNEKTVYFIFHGLSLAIITSIIHSINDWDRMEFSVCVQILPIRVRSEIAKTVICSGLNSLVFSFFHSLLYLFLKRHILSFTLQIFRLLLYKLNKLPLSYWPFSIKLFLFSTFNAFIMLLLWNSVHSLFRVYLSHGPMSYGKLASERSPDPNGTLLTGLVAEFKPLTRMMAFEELYYILHHDFRRCEQIFNDIDRSPAMWQQIVEICLKIISDIPRALQKRYQFSGNKISQQMSPEFTHQFHSQLNYNTESKNTDAIPSLTIKNQNIFLDKHVRKRAHIDRLKHHNYKDELSFHSKAPSKNDKNIYKLQFENFIAFYLTLFYKSWIGIPFRQSLQRKYQILFPNTRLLILAIFSLCQLVARSTDQDSLGMVQHEVALVLECLHVAFEDLKQFIRSPQTHFPDTIHFPDSHNNVFEEPNALLKTLEFGMLNIISKFGPYLSGMHLQPATALKCQTLADFNLLYY